MNIVFAVVFAITCFATATVSNSIMGAGIWFWVIIATGAFVGVSQFIPSLQGAGAGLAGLLAILSICAVLLGLLAATVGGSFRLNESEALLLFLFFIIAVLGLTLASMHKKSLKGDIGINK
jgi:hypothetical protein